MVLQLVEHVFGVSAITVELGNGCDAVIAIGDEDLVFESLVGDQWQNRVQNLLPRVPQVLPSRVALA